MHGRNPSAPAASKVPKAPRACSACSARTAFTAARHGERGAAAVEFALVMLVLVPLLLGTVEVGRALIAWDTLARSARAAARHLAVGTPSDATRQLEARCLAITGSAAAGASSCSQPVLLPGLTPQMVAILEPASSPGVRAVATGAGTLDLVTVSVAGYAPPLLGWSVLPALTFGPISVTVPYVFF